MTLGTLSVRVLEAGRAIEDLEQLEIWGETRKIWPMTR